jgi:hypothetical protein
MTPEAQRIKIAEACGWKHVTWNGGDSIPFGDNPKGNKSSRAYDHLPDYLNDLNAIKEAEDRLDEVTHGLYRGTLRAMITGRQEAIPVMNGKEYRAWFSATAAQRAEAFLRTLNLWEE